MTSSTKPSDDLDEEGRDVNTALAKAILGLIPYAGSAVAEVVGFAIPRQRIDRVVAFVRRLEAELSAAHKDLLRAESKSEYLTDLVEEAVRQSARSVSEERRAYLSSLLSKSLTIEQVEHAASRQLLRLLGELSDVEVIWLRSYLDPVIGRDQEFHEQHRNILEPVRAHMGSDEDTIDDMAVQESYREHLAQLGLLEPHYRINSKTKQVELDSSSGAPKIARHEITLLGRLLLKRIGLADKGDA